MLDKLMGNTTNAKASAPGHTEKWEKYTEMKEIWINDR
jgi:hypothetical protein